MRVPITWLREYVDLPADAQTIADRLAMLGFPVEEIESRPTITGVIVGAIVAQTKHPNADKLQICTVDIGAGQPVTIATAATNTAVGQVIPVATIGARLPHLTIERRKMRGVESEGMMCSAEELALPPEWFDDGIMQLDPGTPLGANVVELFGLSHAILDVEITSNRVDAMSVLGLARELAASFDLPLRVPSFENPGRDDGPTAPNVTIASPDCTRFVAQYFDGVTIAPAPAWMRIRLALAGQRPINNLVDISNYVMFETAQPLHFYDARHVANHHFVVRDARNGESLVTLDDSTRTLDATMLVIADDRIVLGLAGLMGGAASEVRDDTTSIILESASFGGGRVRRMSTHFGLRTEASSRHEKTLAPALADLGAARAAQLLASLGAHAYRPQVFGETSSVAARISLRAHDVTRLLGLHLPDTRIAAHLERLGCVVEAHEDALLVTPPAWRNDLTIAADLVEEVARIEGYDAIEPIEPSVAPHAISSAAYDREEHIADELRALGYREIITYALHGADVYTRTAHTGFDGIRTAVEVRNPLSEDQRYLRSSLEPRFLEYFARVDSPVRIFEIGHVFRNENGAVRESSMVAFAFTAEPADEPSWRDTHFLACKGDAEALLRALTGRPVAVTRGEHAGLHPGKTAALTQDGRVLATVGRVDPRYALAFGVRLPAYVCIIDIDALPAYVAPTYHPPSKFPSTSRDLALIVDFDVTATRIAETTARAIGDLCTGVRVFDEYRGPQVGEGRKSVAVRATLQHFDRTITDEEADAAITRTIDVLHDQLGATIRT